MQISPTLDSRQATSSDGRLGLRALSALLIVLAGLCLLPGTIAAQESSVRDVKRTWVPPTRDDPDGSQTQQARFAVRQAQRRFDQLVGRRAPDDPELLQATAALRQAQNLLRQYTGYEITEAVDNSSQNQQQETEFDETDDGTLLPPGSDNYRYLVEARKLPLVSTGPVTGVKSFPINGDPGSGAGQVQLVVRGRVLDQQGYGVDSATVVVTINNKPKVLTTRNDGSYEHRFTVEGHTNRAIRFDDLVLRPPCLSVEPEVIRFGPLPPGTSRQRRVAISNTCDHTVKIEWDRLVAGPDNAFTLDWDDQHTGGPSGTGYIHGRRTRDAILGPGVRLPVIISFSPTTARPYSGELSVSEKEPPGPKQQVSFFGSAGAITVSPDRIDFGIVKEQELGSRTVTISNVSQGQVAIELRLDGNRDDFIILQVGGNPHLAGQPISIAAGASLKVVLMCRPTSGPEPVRNGRLAIESRTTGLPSAEVELSVMAAR